MEQEGGTISSLGKAVSAFKEFWRRNNFCWGKANSYEERTWSIYVFGVPLAFSLLSNEVDEVFELLDKKRTKLAKYRFWGSRFSLTIFDAIWIFGIVIDRYRSELILIIKEILGS